MDISRALHRKGQGPADPDTLPSTAAVAESLLGWRHRRPQPRFASLREWSLWATPLAPILSHWLDNHLFVASTLIGYTVMERFPEMKVVMAHGKASWMEEVLEKMEASTRVIPLQHYYPRQYRAGGDLGERPCDARF